MDLKTGPWRITFDTNPDDCNLSCIMCEDHSPHSTTLRERIIAKLPRRRMEIDLIQQILVKNQGGALREIIPSTMGEPLLYKHFSTILELCQQYALKLNLTTNGTFPKKGVTNWAKLILPVTSDVKISWNGATKTTQEKIMLGTNWENVLNNLKRFIAMRNEFFKTQGHYCSVTLQLTFLETNLHEIGEIVRLGMELGVDRIKGHHLWAHFNEIKPLSMRKDTESILRWNQAVKEAQAIAETPMANGKLIKLENIYQLSAQTDKNLVLQGECPFLGKEAWVASDGRFSPCCAPDKERRKLGDFGSLTNKTLAEIWHSEEYQSLCKNYMQNEVCKGCNMRKFNTTTQTSNFSMAEVI